MAFSLRTLRRMQRLALLCVAIALIMLVSRWLFGGMHEPSPSSSRPALQVEMHGHTGWWWNGGAGGEGHRALLEGQRGSPGEGGGGGDAMPVGLGLSLPSLADAAAALEPIPPLPPELLPDTQHASSAAHARPASFLPAIGQADFVSSLTSPLDLAPLTSPDIDALHADGRVSFKKGDLHPIPALLKRAMERWEEKLSRQSSNGVEAVAEYRRRYGRNPPKGYDQWYAFARENSVVLIDEFDRIHKDLELFWAMSPETMAERLETASKWPFTWGCKVEDGVVSLVGELAHHDRAKGQMKLMQRFAHHLPNLLAWYNGHDTPRVALTWEERQRLKELIRTEQYDQVARDEDTAQPPSDVMDVSVVKQCPPDSPVRTIYQPWQALPMDMKGTEMPDPPKTLQGEEADAVLLVDHLASYNGCSSPYLRFYHTALTFLGGGPCGQLYPFFSMGANDPSADILAVPTEQVEDPVGEDIPWREKDDKLVWRGQTSGLVWSRHTPWRTSQRARAHLLTHEDGSDPKTPPVRNVTYSDRRGAVQVAQVPKVVLNELMDVGMVGPPVQCIREDGTCDEMERTFKGYASRMSKEEANRSKYVLDIDGNSWSGRFHRLLSSNSAVVKATMYPEWFSDWIEPWLHYIPISPDYSDLYDVMAYFRGFGDNPDAPPTAVAHDGQARFIAEEGKLWVQDHFRWQDMEAYAFRLYLEYGRLLSPDRENMDYVGTGEELDSLAFRPRDRNVADME